MKSPIEIRLRDALRRVPAGIGLIDYTDGPSPIGIMDDCEPHWDVERAGAACDSSLALERKDQDGCLTEVYLFSDVPILSYRADLYLRCEGYSLAIECDGHDYHDRTKQQAAYDRSRDRDLLKLDISTIRFTGSEIHHSPDRCAADVWAIVRMFDARSASSQHTFSLGWKSGRKRALADISGAGAMAGVV